MMFGWPLMARHALRPPKPAQIPLLDGLEVTKAIRELESSKAKPIDLLNYTTAYDRVQIIAVSASLSGHRVHEYVQADFDGWI
ncbi:hypothetical protein DL98DRAFT_9230 [Cadophora sp. DSE1049]|nr:hypothetical protein DL98DRAFT_9230 [Cadophora sp. DSE1049]